MTLNKTRWIFVLEISMMLLVCSVITITAQAKGGAPCNGYNVTSTINDYFMGNTANPFQLQSDGNEIYTTFTNKKDQVSSEIQPSCDYALYTASSTTRGMTLTFMPVSGSSLPSFDSAGSPLPIHGDINDTCVSPGFKMTGQGQSVTCNMQVSFTIDGTDYIMALNPDNFDKTSWMRVTCNSVASGVCNHWTVAPDSATSQTNPVTGQVFAIAALHVQGDTTNALGYYYFSFNLTVTNP